MGLAGAGTSSVAFSAIERGEGSARKDGFGGVEVAAQDQRVVQAGK